MNNLHVITQNNDNNLSLKYLLALLNSKLLDYYHYLLNPEKGEALAEIKKENVAKLPIKVITDQQQKPFIKLVDQILKIKQSDPNADTSQLEREIDLLVYELYGLTEEEIKIVEAT
jgi:adenine-specific DNA-methyltransferase